MYGGISQDGPATIKFVIAAAVDARQIQLVCVCMYVYIREYGFYFFIHTYINRYIHQHIIGTDLIDSDKLVGSKPAVIEHRYLYMCLKKHRSGYFKMLHIHTYIHTYMHALILT